MGGRDTPKERYHSARDCPRGLGPSKVELRKDLHPSVFLPSTRAVLRGLCFPTSVATSGEVGFSRSPEVQLKNECFPKWTLLLEAKFSCKDHSIPLGLKQPRGDCGRFLFLRKTSFELKKNLSQWRWGEGPLLDTDWFENLGHGLQGAFHVYCWISWT